MWGYGKGIFFVLLLLFFITFGIENSETVQLKYYADSLTLTLPLYGLIFALALIGVCFGLLVGFWSRHRLRKTVKALQLEIIELKDSVSELKESG